MFRWCGLGAVLLAASGHGLVRAAEPPARVALVVGVGAYENAPALPKARGDARTLAEALRGLGFEVRESLDPDRRGLAEALRDFSPLAAEADAAVIYFSGHGLQVSGTNYLIPADARLERIRDLVYETMPLDLVLGEVSQAREIGIVILDAARDNPFAEALSRTAEGGRSPQVGVGLARLDEAPGDTLVAFAARADRVAEDEPGDHGPYAAALLRHLTTPGLEVGLFFRRVRETVMERTGGRQEPVTFGSVGATPFYFNPKPENRVPLVRGAASVEVPAGGGGTRMGVEVPEDPDADPLFATVTGLPRGGSVQVGDRMLLIGDHLTPPQLAATSFVPDASLTGPVGSFEFVVNDGRGGVARGSVSISVAPVALASPAAPAPEARRAPERVATAPAPALTPAPVPTIAAAPAPAQQDDSIGRLRLTLGALPCSVLGGGIVDGRVRVAGHARRGEDVEGLKARIASDIPEATEVVFDVSPLEPFQCAPVERLAPEIRRNRETGGVRIRVSRSTLLPGEPLTLTVRGLPGRRHVQVDLFGPDGSVEHLTPKGGLVVQPDGRELRFGGPGDRPITGPPGPRLVLLTLSDSPLAVAHRADGGQAGEYLKALRQALGPAGDGAAVAEFATFQLRPGKPAGVVGARDKAASTGQSPSGARDPRCRRIVERGQMGEALSDADRAFLRGSCG